MQLVLLVILIVLLIIVHHAIVHIIVVNLLVLAHVLVMLDMSMLPILQQRQLVQLVHVQHVLVYVKVPIRNVQHVTVENFVH